MSTSARALKTIYALSLLGVERFEEAKTLSRKMMPVARRVFGESHEVTLKMNWIYGRGLCLDADATLKDLREAVATLEDTVRIARRVLGSAHPTTAAIEPHLPKARAALRARETPSSAGEA